MPWIEDNDGGGAGASNAPGLGENQSDREGSSACADRAGSRNRVPDHSPRGSSETRSHEFDMFSLRVPSVAIAVMKRVAKIQETGRI